MDEEEDRPGPAGREAAGITAKPEDFVRYVRARDRLREARRDLSEDVAREELLDAYETGRIEARPGHNYRAPINVQHCRQNPRTLDGTWWHAGDLDQMIAEKSPTSSQSSKFGRPPIPAEELKAVLLGWAEEGVLTANWSAEAKRLAVCRRVFLSDKPGETKGIYEHDELSAEHKRLMGRSK